jgi:hypothetical protein
MQPRSTLPAAVLEAATAGCELEDCAEKAVVLFYVDAALANVTNAYLAFSTVSDTVLYSEEDFQERAAVFAETLQEVANLNANLTDYFVSCLACPINCLACLLWLHKVALPCSKTDQRHNICLLFSSPLTSLLTSLKMRGMD